MGPAGAGLAQEALPLLAGVGANARPCSDRAGWHQRSAPSGVGLRMVFWEYVIRYHFKTTKIMKRKKTTVPGGRQTVMATEVTAGAGVQQVSRGDCKPQLSRARSGPTPGASDFRVRGGTR